MATAGHLENYTCTGQEENDKDCDQPNSAANSIGNGHRLGGETQNIAPASDPITSNVLDTENPDSDAGESTECKPVVQKISFVCAGDTSGYSALDTLLHKNRPSNQALAKERIEIRAASKGDRFSDMENHLLQFMLKNKTQRHYYRLGKTQTGKVSWEKFAKTWKVNLQILQIRSSDPQFPYAEPVYALRTPDQLKDRSKVYQN